MPRLLGHFRLDPAPDATPTAVLDAARRVVAMDYATQIHYTHGVPKTSATIGERISLAFRVKPDQQPPKASGDSGVSGNLARMRQ